MPRARVALGQAGGLADVTSLFKGDSPVTPKTTLTAVIAAALAATTGLVAAPAMADHHKEAAPASPNIVQTAMSTGVHNTLVAAVKAAHGKIVTD